MNQSKTGSARSALERIVHTPELARVVPQLRPELLHRVIQGCGLEDCVDLLPLVTPSQLADVFDLDLWHAARPGGNERFDPERFGLWIEVLAEAGPAVAAQKLAGIDVDLVIAGLAQHVLVFDQAAVADYVTLDGELIAPAFPDDRLTADVGGYVVVSRRADAWDAVVSVLTALAEEQPSRFHELMAGCRASSNSRPEVDGLDDLLAHGDQAMFDVAIDRERRRERDGYVTAGDACAFLAMSRKTDPESVAAPTANPIARAYFRALDDAREESPGMAPAQLPAASRAASASSSPQAESVAAVMDVLVEAGLLKLDQDPRALLPSGPQTETPRLARIRAAMDALNNRNPAAFARKIDELMFLANTLKAGCAIQARSFTGQEAWDAVVGVCNLALEVLAPADELLADRDLISLFQAGWTILHDDVAMYAAAGLVDVLRTLRCRDRAIQLGLHTLRVEMTRHLRTGTPWRARDAMDVLASLDLPSWAALLGLIAECPVLVTEGATAFEFISEKSQIQSVQAFVQSLGEKLAG